MMVSGKDNSIVTKIEEKDNQQNCMVGSEVMETGTHIISMRLTQSSSKKAANWSIYTFVGVARDGTACDKRHATKNNDDVWFLCSAGASLSGHGKKEDHHDRLRITEDMVISMELNCDKGTLLFWVDGRRRMEHKAGWTEGITGKLRWYDIPVLQ